MKKASFCAALVCLATLIQESKATLYLSNLNDLWPTPGIGDIHGLFPGGIPNGSDVINFRTGAGTFSVNHVTFEFEFDSADPGLVAAPQWINIQLSQQTGNTQRLLGSFGNPTLDSMLTQWPITADPNAFTWFIDFWPREQITLNSDSQYSLVLSMPANSPTGASLLFTQSSSYISPAGWTMALTIYGEGFGEYLVMAFDATAVPEPNPAAVFACGCMVLMACRGVLRRNP